MLISTHPPILSLPSHHKFTQLRKDEMRTSKMQYKWHFLNGLLFQPTVARGVMSNGPLPLLPCSTLNGRHCVRPPRGCFSISWYWR
jgi:hypothetical protein